MRLIRFLDADGGERFGQDRGDGTATVAAGELFDRWKITDETAGVDKLLAPCSPSNIYCIGLNYREHAKESGKEIPKNPVVFMKSTACVTNPGDNIQLPACCDPEGEVDYECELAVVIGKPAKNVSETEALDYVFGYTAANDVSARKWQAHGGGGQWIRGKGFDTFCPLGPALVTADEISDPNSLRIRTILNGETMQDHSTSDMIFNVRQLIHFLSQDTTLLPGTVILTGTPQGVGFARNPPIFLKPGDQVTIEIEGIGRLANPVVRASTNSQVG